MFAVYTDRTVAESILRSLLFVEAARHHAEYSYYALTGPKRGRPAPIVTTPPPQLDWGLASVCIRSFCSQIRSGHER